MTKKELTTALAANTGLTAKLAEEVYNSMVETVTRALVKGDEVNMFGLGIFKTAKRPARKGHNPATGEAITIPACTKVSFKVSKTLKDAVN